MFCDPIHSADFPQRGNEDKTGHGNTGLHSGVISKPDFLPLWMVPVLWYASTHQGIDLVQSHVSTLDQMPLHVPMSDVDVTCHHVL